MKKVQGRPFALTPYNCTKRTKLIKNGYVDGRVSYQDIWGMGSVEREDVGNPDAIGKVEHSRTPGNHPIGSQAV